MRVRRWTFRTLAALALLYVYFSTLHPHLVLAHHPIFDAAGPWVIAHRGGRGLWPENTLLAFENAEALGVDVIEMDLRATADGAIVVIHDATVDRTTNGTGRVSEMTLAEVKKLDAAHTFTNTLKQFPFRAKGVTVPTLDETLARLPRARLNLEMKAFTQDLAVKLCRLIQERAATARVLVASFPHAPMAAFRDACPSVATSATWPEAFAFFQLPRLRLSSLYRSPAVALQVPETARSYEILRPRVLEIARASRIKVQVWTVNDEAAMKRLLDLGVHGILTDYPDRLMRVMGRPIGSGGKVSPGSAHQSGVR